MEPIRPDDEDLRATPAGKPAASTDKKLPARPAAGGRKGTVILTLLIVALAAALAGVWFEQGQRISALEGQLEEADYWVRQSKLALARFESTLSETGESLEETGTTMAQKLDQHEAELKSTNSEIRKLWVVANERNKKRLDDQQAQLQSIQGDLTSQQADLKGWAENLDTLKAGFAQQLAALEQADAAVREQIKTVQQSVAGVDGQITKRLERFEQEEQLGKAEVASRLQALEQNNSAAASKIALNRAQQQLTVLENTVKSIDASRSQLTSRLVRLSNEVNVLKARTAQ